MPVTMPELFRWSRKGLLITITIFGLCLVIAQTAVQRHYNWYAAVTGLAQILLILTPLLALATLGMWVAKRFLNVGSLAQAFRWSRWGLGLSAGLFALCAVIAQLSMLQSYDLYLATTFIAQLTLYVAPPLALIALVTGIATYFSRRKKSAQSDSRMSRIMQRLSPDERDYLREKLDEQLIALGEDGELLSVDDLLDDQDQQDLSEL